MKKLLNWFVFLLVTTAIATSGLFAWEVNAASNSNFSVRAVIPQNQSDKNQTYFDLRMTPGQQQTVQLVVTNSENEKIKAKISLNAATTGRNGLIVYNRSGTKRENSGLSIKDIATVVHSEIDIPAKKSAVVEVDIRMPNESFDGVILGGIVVTAEKVSVPQAAVGDGITLNNEYAYVIGLKITENEAKVAPDFALESVEPGLVNYRNAVVINLANTKPLIIKGMEVEAKIYKKNQKNIFRELFLDYAEMAPNSIGEFVVDWESSLLESGEYRLYMVVRYQGQEWVWDENFTISREAAGEANENAVGIVTRPVWLYGLAGAGVLAVVLLAYFLGKRNARKDDEELDEEKGIDPHNQAEGD